MHPLTLDLTTEQHNALNAYAEKNGVTPTEALMAIFREHVMLAPAAPETVTYRWSSTLRPSERCHEITVTSKSIKETQLLLDRNRVIDAIKVLRAANGIGLYEAKTIVDIMRGIPDHFIRVTSP